ncbi:MAG: filamentous hemagglutinin N-terminal domain-containing protein [Xenococcaceae cyanobacterium]
MKQLRPSFWITGGYLLCNLATTHSSLAQISPDGTLPTNVTKSGNVFEINGGGQAGSNLFHSFAEFSVPTGTEAFFNNPLTIENIITRVTGGNISNIDGILRANGMANLFLLNPNGIIFGPNAQLDIGGSFVGSTASGIRFADGTFFSATDTQTPPLLTISAPVGLQFGDSAEPIVNQSNASPPGAMSTFGQPVGLQVQPGKTLVLVGGDVGLEGGNLTALGGRIELGSVSGNSFVSLTPTNQGWQLGYEGVQNFQDIQLSQGALVDASGAGGIIQVQGRRVRLTDGSQIFNDTLGADSAGNLTVNASESVELIGTAPTGIAFPSGLFAQVLPGTTGSGGNLIINTKRLIIRDGGAVSAGTFTEGAGGSLEVNASEFVELIGTSRGAAPSLLTTSTIGAGAGGDLTINTRRLIVRDGAQVQAVTFAEGRGGTLTVNASESVEAMGTGITGTGIQLSSGLFAASGIEGLPIQPSGDGGSLMINTGQLIVRDGAEVSVGSIGSGDAGNLEITASSIFLDNQGKLTATTASGNGGNISLQNLDLLQLRRSSQISTSAGGSGDGGNLNIDTDILVVLESSKITADAFQGQGGNIQITTQGLFLSPDSKITASSQLGIDGMVAINTPEVDPSSGLVELPMEVVDVQGLVTQGCRGSGNIAAGEFIITGRGGVPPNPNETITDNPVLVDLGYPSSSITPHNHSSPIENQQQSAVTPQPTDASSKPIVEAQGWIIDANGKVLLTAQAPTVTPHSPGLTTASCHDS